MRVLFIGDIFGKPGREAFYNALPVLRTTYGNFDFIIVNCENAASGSGMTERIMNEFFEHGVDVMTSGNHIWDKKEFVPILSGETRVLRPANYPSPAPGRGYGIFTKDKTSICVVSMMGRAFMPPLDCPFQTMEHILSSVDTRVVFVDLHAEATAEKIAFAKYFDGRVSAVVGTHTHVQTADNTVLSRGSAYITDAGMTGGHGGVIGVKLESVIPKFLMGTPTRFEVEESAKRVQGVVVDIDDETGRALDIQRVDMPTD